MSWKGHEHFLFLFSGRRQEFAKRRTANSCNARDDYVQTSLTLIVVAVPANTNGFSHLYTNPPVISPLWRSLPALPIPTTGRRSVGQKTAVSRQPAEFNIWPMHTTFEMREDGYIVANGTRAQRWRKEFLNNRWQRRMTELHTRS